MLAVASLFHTSSFEEIDARKRTQVRSSVVDSSTEKVETASRTCWIFIVFMSDFKSSSYLMSVFTLATTCMPSLNERPVSPGKQPSALSLDKRNKNAPGLEMMLCDPFIIRTLSLI